MTGEMEPRVERSFKRVSLFLASAAAIYGVLYAIAPDTALTAMKASARISFSLCLPLFLVFSVMFLMNLFVRPAGIARIFSKNAGIKGMSLSVAAGIISTGPIFAWYPLMKKMMEEGAGEGQIAVFLYNRAVKPFLLPVMIVYFGWIYVGILTILTILGSILLGYFMNAVCGE
jgi:hypothetical protein